jgi:hypothetical protein
LEYLASPLQALSFCIFYVINSNASFIALKVQK